MKAFWHLTTVAICTMIAQCAFAAGASFGPAARTNTSPHQLWEIRSKQDKEHEGHYSLILRNRQTQREQEIFSGDRWCEVLWSADDSRIAITDWRGSDGSDILLKATNQKGSAKELADAAARAF